MQILKTNFKSVLLFPVLLFFIQTGYSQEIVPMVKVRDQPIVVGTLNGKKAYFLIDTGSSISMLNSSDKRKFRFDLKELQLKDYALSGLHSQRRGKVEVALNIEMLLGNQKIYCNFIAFDLTTIVRAIHSGTGIHINGIIGSDLMKNYGFVINYVEEKISFNKD